MPHGELLTYVAIDQIMNYGAKEKKAEEAEFWRLMRYE